MLDLKWKAKLERKAYSWNAFDLRVNNLVTIANETTNFTQRQHEAIDQIEEWAATMAYFVDDADLKARWQRLCK